MNGKGKLEKLEEAWKEGLMYSALLVARAVKHLDLRILFAHKSRV